MNTFTKVLLSVPLLLSTVACSSVESSPNRTIQTDLNQGIIKINITWEDGWSEAILYGPKGVDYTNFKCVNRQVVIQHPNDPEWHDVKENGEQFAQSLLGKFCSVSGTYEAQDHVLFGY
jgi:hypothetical protein